MRIFFILCSNRNRINFAKDDNNDKKGLWMVVTRRSAASDGVEKKLNRKNDRMNDIAAGNDSDCSPSREAEVSLARHAKNHNSMVDSIAEIFASKKLSDFSKHMKTDGDVTAINELCWKPQVSLPQRPKPKSTQEQVQSRHGNSYVDKAGGPGKKISGKEISKRWFQLPVQEITDEIKTDLRVLRLRSAFDPKQFYKKFDETKFPTNFQMGTVVESSADFYSGRLTNKQRKRTMADEIMHDPHLTLVRKKRFSKIQENASHWSKKPNGRKTDNPRIRKKSRKAKH
jgi:hypothetical protein